MKWRFILIPLGIMLALSILFVGVQSVSAAQNDWEINTDFRTGVELSVVSTYPDHPIPLGSRFNVAVNAWTDVGAIDSLRFDPLVVGPGCEVIFSDVDVSSGLTDKSINANSVLRIIGPVCNWQRNVTVIDNVLGEIATVRAVGTMVAISVSAGSFGFDGVEVLALFVLVFGGLLVWSKSGDVVVQLGGVVAVLAAGLAFLSAPSSAWMMGQTLGVVLLVFAGYLVVRWSFDCLVKKEV